MTRNPLLSTPVLAGALVLLTSAVPAQQSMTLQECLKAAVARSRNLAARRAEARAAHLNAAATRGERLPRLDVSSSYHYQTHTQEIRISAPVPGTQETTIKFGDADAADAWVAVRAPLYTGGILKARQEAARYQAEAAAYRIRSDSLDLIHTVRRAYFRALGAREYLHMAETHISRLERHVAQIRRALAVGAASDESLVAARARLVETRAQREHAVCALEIAEEQLGDGTGLPGQRVTPSGGLEVSLLRVQRTAVELDRRSALLVLEQRVHGLTAQRKAAEGAFLPQVSAVIAYHYANPGIDPVANEWMQYGTAGLQASWTLWDWDIRSHRVQRAAAARAAIQRQRERMRESLTTAQSNAGRHLDAARNVLDLKEERVQLEQQAVEYVQTRYEQGRATEIEWLDQQDALAEAETAFAQARADLRLAEADWLHASGY